jgi:hypothetical protein
MASHLACVSGVVSGADLKMRLEEIMKKDDVNELSRGKRMMLGMLAFSAVAAPILVGLTLTDGANARAAEAATNTSAQSADPVGKIELLAGKRVRLHYRNVDVRALIKAMADAARVNILVSDQVSGTVTVNLVETDWDQALDIILHAKGLAKHEKDGVVFVGPASASKEG